MRIERQKFIITECGDPDGMGRFKVGDEFIMDVIVYNKPERMARWLKRLWCRLRWGV